MVLFKIHIMEWDFVVNLYLWPCLKIDGSDEAASPISCFRDLSLG